MPKNGSITGRDPATGRFTQGNNCGGRIKRPDWLYGKGEEALRFAYKVMNDEDARLEIRMQAAKMLIEYDLGKPRQAVEIDATSLPPVIFADEDKIPD